MANNVMQIAQQLLSNQHFKLLLKDQITYIIHSQSNKNNNQQQQFNNNNSHSQVSSVIDDLSETLSTILNTTLTHKTLSYQQQLTKYYQQILSSNITSFQNTINAKLQLIKQQISFQLNQQFKNNLSQEIKLQFKKLNISNKQTNTKTRLAHQRKVLGQSLLLNCTNISKINHLISQNEQNNYHHSNSFLQQNTSNTSQFYNKNNVQNSTLSDNSQISKIQISQLMELSSINARLTRIEQSQKLIINKVKGLIEKHKKIDLNEEDLKKLSQKIFDMKLKIDENIQQGFSGLWNVISNIENKILSLTQIFMDSQNLNFQHKQQVNNQFEKNNQ